MSTIRGLRGTRAPASEANAGQPGRPAAPGRRLDGGAINVQVSRGPVGRELLDRSASR